MPRRRTYKPKKRPNAFDHVLAEREAQRKRELEESIDRFIEFTKEHPSIHERMPR